MWWLHCSLPPYFGFHWHGQSWGQVLLQAGGQNGNIFLNNQNKRDNM
jgi:hypothetical protein